MIRKKRNKTDGNISIDEKMESFFKGMEQICKIQREEAERIRELRERQREEAERIRELRERQREEAERIRELNESINKMQRETNEQIRKLSKEIGHLTNSWGEYHEDFVAPAVEKIARELLKVKRFLGPRILAQDDDTGREYDFLVFGRMRKKRVVLIVSVKTKPHKDDVEELTDSINDFRLLFPEHAEAKKIGMIVYIRKDKRALEKAHRAGFYTASISEDVCELTIPARFKPRQFP